MSPSIDTVKRVLCFSEFDGVVRHVLGGGKFRYLKAHEHVCLYIARQLFGCLSPPIGEADIHQVLRDLLPVLECVLEGADDQRADLEYTVVGIADGAYVTWSGRDGFVEVATGNKLEFLPKPPMTTISIDVHSALFRMSEIYKDMEPKDASIAKA
jgi:hypothetical protein